MQVGFGREQLRALAAESDVSVVFENHRWGWYFFCMRRGSRLPASLSFGVGCRGSSVGLILEGDNRVQRLEDEDVVGEPRYGERTYCVPGYGGRI
jgi:hypothetical protein